MKKYTKPSMEIVDLKVEENITAPTTFYRRGVAINLLGQTTTTSASINNGVALS